MDEQQGHEKVSGIAAALRASPLVGARLDLDRPIVEERAVDLGDAPKAAPLIRRGCNPLHRLRRSPSP